MDETANANRVIFTKLWISSFSALHKTIFYFARMYIQKRKPHSIDITRTLRTRKLSKARMILLKAKTTLKYVVEFLC